MRKFESRMKSIEKAIKALSPDDYPFVWLNIAEDCKSIVAEQVFANYSEVSKKHTLKTEKQLKAYFEERPIVTLFLGEMYGIEIVSGSLADKVFNDGLGWQLDFIRAKDVER